MKRLLIVVLFALVCLPVIALPQEAPEAGAASRPLSSWDTLRIASVSAPTLSPDGQWVLYTQTERDLDAEQLDSRTHVWRVRVDGSARRQMTRGDKSARAPQWLPDGSGFAFLSDRGEGDDAKAQVWAMYVDGGEAWAVTEHADGVDAFQVSPDGRRVLFTALDAESERDKERKKLRDDAVVVDAEFRWTHLWVVDFAGGEAQRLTAGDFTVSDAQWSPDSGRIAYVTRPNTKLDDTWNSDIWVADLRADAPSLRKLFENPGPDAAPRWSPDGSSIAFAAHGNVSTTTWFSRLYLVPADGGAATVLLQGADVDFDQPIWSPDGRDVFWSSGQRASTELFAVQLATDETRGLGIPAGGNSQFELSADGSRWVWVHTAPEWPAEIVTAAASDPSRVTVLTDANAWMRQEQVAIARVVTTTWRNSEGQEIEGVLYYPPGYREGERYPLVVNPHGGPSSARITAFSATDQVIAGNGFVVFQPNFRGSSNYGQEFLNANRNEWGRRDYDDIMTGVDALIERGIADPERMVAYGWSYGGYMTFWMSTQTDRFKLISPGAGLSNLYSMYSTTDISRYLEWFLGTPWDNEDIYRQLSPIRHVKNVTARILIMHGADDARVPPEQAVEFHRALLDLGKDVVYVSYPRQGHGITDPRLQVDRLRRYVFAFADALGTTVLSEKPEDDPWAPPAEGEATGSTVTGVIEPARTPAAMPGLDPLLGTDGGLALRR